MSGLQFVFVHGLSGWGSYDKTYRRMPYWGMRGGDLMAFLREKGFDCYAASVSPAGSAWDWWSKILARILSMGTKGKPDGRDERDNANYDMYLDRARELNLRITTLPDVFYFSVPCSAAEKQPDGTFLPARGMEPLFVARSRQIGAYSGRTVGGMVVDESWRENDGLVNTVSAMVPTGAPSKPLNRENAERGM